MDSIGQDTLAFIVRIWIEPREITDVAPIWRGTIEHVPDGNRNYLRTLDDIAPYIASYLEEKGITAT